MAVEDVFVNMFVVREKRARYAQLLTNARRRTKILDRLNHAFDYDRRFASTVPKHVDIDSFLRAKGAPDTCHVIADSHALDGKDVSLQVALSELWGHGFGYVLICLPERLAYYQPEAPSEPVLLERQRNG